MIFQNIEFQMVSASPEQINFPIVELNEDMWVAVDAAMADRWHELGGNEGIEQGFNLEQITNINAYLLLQPSKSNPRIGYKLDISTSGGVVLTRKKRIRTDGESMEALADLLDEYFAMGAPGLNNEVRTFLEQQHKAFRQKSGSNKANNNY